MGDDYDEVFDFLVGDLLTNRPDIKRVIDVFFGPAPYAKLPEVIQWDTPIGTDDEGFFAKWNRSHRKSPRP